MSIVLCQSRRTPSLYRPGLGSVPSLEFVAKYFGLFSGLSNEFVSRDSSEARPARYQGD